MSVENLKSRLRDVPGIETLTMTLIAGRQAFGFNGLIAAVDPNASDDEIEKAIRSAAGIPTTGGAINSEASSATPIPPVNITEPKPMTEQSPTGFVPGEISSMFKTLRARKDAMVADVMKNGAEVAATLEAGEKMSAALKAEGDAMKAEFGLLTNNPPA